MQRLYNSHGDATRPLIASKRILIQLRCTDEALAQTRLDREASILCIHYTASVVQSIISLYCNLLSYLCVSPTERIAVAEACDRYMRIVTRSARVRTSDGLLPRYDREVVCSPATL